MNKGILNENYEAVIDGEKTGALKSVPVDEAESGQESDFDHLNRIIREITMANQIERFVENAYIDESKLIPINIGYEEKMALFNGVGIVEKKHDDGTVKYKIHDINLLSGYIFNSFGRIIRTIGGEYALYNYKKGLYDIYRLSDNSFEIEQIIRYICNYSGLNIWNDLIGKRALKGLIMEIKDTVVTLNSANIINFANGIYLLDHGKMVTHSPEFLSTSQLPFSYDPNAGCEVFHEKVLEILSGDHELFNIIQKIFGYVLSNSNAANVAFWFMGTGRNGKSLITSLLQNLVGEQNVAHLPLKNLNEKFDLEVLINKRLNVADENKHVRDFDTAIFKSIVSNEPIFINRKNQKGINVQLSMKMIMLFNRPPEIPEASVALYERLILIPFKRKFTREDADKYLYENLLKELPGIMNFAIEGYGKLKAQKFLFEECQLTLEAKEEFAKGNMPIYEFFQQHYEPHNESKIVRADIFKAYQKWAVENQRQAFQNAKDFYNELENVLDSQGLSCIYRKISTIHLIGYRKKEIIIADNQYENSDKVTLFPLKMTSTHGV